MRALKKASFLIVFTAKMRFENWIGQLVSHQLFETFKFF